MNPGDRVLKSQGFVITQSDYGEADRLVTLFTQKKGKVKAFVRGVKKSRSRKAGHLQSLSLINLMLAKGKTFWVITQVDTIEVYAGIKADLEKTAQALYILELVNRFAPEEEPITRLFDLVQATLTRVERLENTFFAIKYFELHLLQIIGYRPELNTCVQCGKRIEAQAQYFSAKHGGVVCPDCGLQDEQFIQVSLPALKYLRHIQRSNFSALNELEPREQVSEEVNRVLLYYLTYISERRLNTPLFINQINDQKKMRENHECR